MKSEREEIKEKQRKRQRTTVGRGIKSGLALWWRRGGGLNGNIFAN